MSLSTIKENTHEEGQDSMNIRIPELCANLNIRICMDKKLYYLIMKLFMYNMFVIVYVMLIIRIIMY